MSAVGVGEAGLQVESHSVPFKSRDTCEFCHSELCSLGTAATNRNTAFSSNSHLTPVYWGRQGLHPGPGAVTLIIIYKEGG